jgi:sulfur-oxidizing protein SoxX
LGPENAYAATCKRKAAGFYLLDNNAGAPRPLAAALQGQGLPGSLTGTPGDTERGRDVLVNRQKGDCLSCHKVSTLGGAQGAIGPALDGIGAKYSDAQVRQVLIDPKALFPDTIMPSYYAAAGGSASVLTAAEVEDLIAFLRTLR